LQRLQDAETQANEGPARDAIQDAIAAKAAEIKRYDTIAEAIERIDAQFVKAESTLSELKSQVALAGASAAHTREDSSGLDQVVSELQALGSSLQEAENFLEDVRT
jgi:predicted  nucleic acid-binding Zn-ribbon protein